MEVNELNQKLEDIDRELAQRNISLQQRPFDAFDMLHPGVSVSFLMGPVYGPKLLEQINSWYERRYKNKMMSEFKLGEKPFKLRGEVYYITCPVIFGNPPLHVSKILDLVEDLTLDMKGSLVRDEIDIVVKNFLLGYKSFSSINSIDSLSRFTSSLHKEAKDLINRGIADINEAVSAQKSSGDVQSAIFHAQQAVEKFLKACVVEVHYHNFIKIYRSIDEALKKKYSHEISRIYNDLLKSNQGFKEISQPITNLSSMVPSMKIRYQETNHIAEDAIEAIDSMLQVCRFVSDRLCSKKGITAAFSEDYNIDLPEYYKKAMAAWAWEICEQGLEKVQKGEHSQALEDFNQALRINPGGADAHYNRGVVRYILRDLEGAIEDWSQALCTNPKDAAAYLNRGAAHYELGERQEAIEDSQKAAEIFSAHDDMANYQQALDNIIWFEQ